MEKTYSFYLRGSDFFEDQTNVDLCASKVRCILPIGEKEEFVLSVSTEPVEGAVQIRLKKMNRYFWSWTSSKKSTPRGCVMWYACQEITRAFFPDSEDNSHAKLWLKLV